MRLSLLVLHMYACIGADNPLLESASIVLVKVCYHRIFSQNGHANFFFDNLLTVKEHCKDISKNCKARISVQYYDTLLL